MEMEEVKKEGYKVSGSFKKGVPEAIKANIEKIDDSSRIIEPAIGQMLENMLLKEEGKNFIGVYPSLQEYGDVFTGGIPLGASYTDTIVSGGSNSTDISKTISISSQFWQVISEIQKTSRSAYIVVIPRAFLENKTKPILLHSGDDGRYYLLPEFISCVVKKDENGNAASIFTNPEYRAVHDYPNDGLTYDTSEIPGYGSATPEQTPEPKAQKPTLLDRLRNLRKALPGGSGITPNDTEEVEDHDDHDKPNHPDGPNVVKFNN